MYARVAQSVRAGGLLTRQVQVQSLAQRTSRPQLFTASAGGEHNIYRRSSAGCAYGASVRRPGAFPRRAGVSLRATLVGRRIAGRRAPMVAQEEGE